MLENVKKQSKTSDIKINLKQDHEVQYWSRKWGISALQLESAIKASGTNLASQVEVYLKQSGKLISL